MKKILLTLKFIIFAFICFAQNTTTSNYPYKQYFDEVYQQNPSIPKGLLESIAWTQTHIDNKTPYNTTPSCTGMPFGYGVFALVEDGKGWFRNNLITVSQLSGFTIEEIKNNPEINILAFAKAFSSKINEMEIVSSEIKDFIPVILSLSELHVESNNVSTDFAINSFLYSVLSFLNEQDNQKTYNFPNYNVSLKEIFGDNNLKVLTSKKLQISDHGVISDDGVEYRSTNAICPDYNVAWCSWVASPNYSSRAGTAISAITIHDVEGSYSGAISWFQNPSSQVSAHYVIRSSDGQITQMVLESNKAWHVGSENPYTIGYEHEGYAGQTGWYTTAMYQSSANLSIDICNTYGINPKRTGFWPWLASTYYNVSGIPGSCTQIKGHQHFPNQTHTDPGPNWDWDYYYKLINNTTTATTLTTATGSFYDSGGSGGNYSDDERKIWVINPTGASSVSLNFSAFDLENTWDYIYIYDGADVWSPLIGYYTGTNSPSTVVSSNGPITIEFRSDCSTNAAGWVANWTSASPDNIAPTTSISTPNNWETTDFLATFTDADNIGIEKSFYQVLDFDGTYWGANSNNGFFADNFDILQPFWTNSLGVWNVNTGELTQTDELEGNANLYASLNQNLSNRYLYNFTAKVNSTSTNRRFGFHFFSDDASLPNRGNSYFVWFRIDDQSLQFYKVQNDIFTLVNTVSSVITNIGQYYDYKISYDKVTGKIVVWRDNTYLGSWIDPSPINTNGNFISFRTGNCSINVNELKVYRSRYPSVTITMGDNTKDIRYQNPNPTTFGAKIKSIVVDANNNLSSIDYHDLNIDWTAPSSFSVNDGVSNDVDTIFDNTTVSSVWTNSNDLNSGILEYWFAVGTSPGASDIVNWTNNGANNSITLNGLNLNNGTIYYSSVKSKNGADLWSNICNSDGFIVFPTNIIPNLNEIHYNVFPNPSNGKFYIYTDNILNVSNITIQSLNGKLLYQSNIFKNINEINLNLPNGVYILKVYEENELFEVKKIQIER